MTLETNPVNVNSSQGWSGSSPDALGSKQDDIAAFAKVLDAAKEHLSSEPNMQIAQAAALGVGSLPIFTPPTTTPNYCPPGNVPQGGYCVNWLLQKRSLDSIGSLPEPGPVVTNNHAGEGSGTATTQNPGASFESAINAPQNAFNRLSEEDKACFEFKPTPGSHCEQVISQFDHYQGRITDAVAGRGTGGTARSEPRPGPPGSEPQHEALPASAPGTGGAAGPAGRVMVRPSPGLTNIGENLPWLGNKPPLSSHFAPVEPRPGDKTSSDSQPIRDPQPPRDPEPPSPLLVPVMVGALSETSKPSPQTQPGDPARPGDPKIPQPGTPERPRTGAPKIPQPGTPARPGIVDTNTPQQGAPERPWIGAPAFHPAIQPGAQPGDPPAKPGTRPGDTQTKAPGDPDNTTPAPNHNPEALPATPYKVHPLAERENRKVGDAISDPNAKPPGAPQIPQPGAPGHAVGNTAQAPPPADSPAGIMTPTTSHSAKPAGTATKAKAATPALNGTKPTTPRRASFGKATTDDYKKTFFDAHPKLKDKVLVHHAVEQQALRRYPRTVNKSEIHSLENLRGVPKARNSKLHLSAIRKEWNKFYRQVKNPTKQQLLDWATRIDQKYGSQFKPAR